ncbi:MAG TPA: FGGY-family carbohydrate kinase [Symbiobacteriaceae bacterium]|nr:FGGY-family carbohydrate kinase [Symbiobacteriaceae bacterium]
MPYLMGIDAGTSVVKCAIFDDQGETVAVSSHSVPILTPHSGWAEQDPVSVWGAVCACTRSALAKAGIHAGEIAALGVCAQGDGLWLVDADLRPVRPAPLWLDGRAGALVEAWQGEGADREYYRWTGSVLFPGVQAALLRWMELHEPHVLRRARWGLYCTDWIVACLTGRVVTDRSNGSRATRALETGAWSPELARVLGLGTGSDLLPEVVDGGTVFGTVSPAAAAATGLPAGLPVASAMIDVSACLIGAGGVVPGNAVTILGSTALSTVISSAPVLEPEVVGINLPLPCGGWARLMSTMAGTLNLDWVLGLVDLDLPTAMSEAASVPPGAGGILFLPFVSPGGERAPFVKPTARAGFFGLGQQTGRAQLVRSVLEGLALAVRHSYAHLPAVSGSVRLVGGGARSPGWCQILADMLGYEIEVLSTEELGALGVALSAGVTLGVLPDLPVALQQWVKPRHRYNPGPAAPLYGDLFRLYTALIDSQMPLWDQRAAISWPTSPNNTEL